MNCLACGTPLRVSRETVRYDDCGLTNVHLVDVEVRRCPSCGEEELVIPAMADLHRVIAEQLALRPTPLAGPEIRFLRKYLGFSQEQLAEEMGLRQETISRYENGHERMGATSERLLRLLVLWGHQRREYEHPPRLRIRGEDGAAPQDILLEHDDTGRWHPRAA